MGSNQSNNIDQTELPIATCLSQIFRFDGSDTSIKFILKFYQDNRVLINGDSNMMTISVPVGNPTTGKPNNAFGRVQYILDEYSQDWDNYIAINDSEDHMDALVSLARKIQRYNEAFGKEPFPSRVEIMDRLRHDDNIRQWAKRESKVFKQLTKETKNVAKNFCSNCTKGQCTLHLCVVNCLVLGFVFSYYDVSGKDNYNFGIQTMTNTIPAILNKRMFPGIAMPKLNDCLIPLVVDFAKSIGRHRIVVDPFDEQEKILQRWYGFKRVSDKDIQKQIVNSLIKPRSKQEFMTLERSSYFCGMMILTKLYRDID